MKLPFTKPAPKREKQKDEFTSSEGMFKYVREWETTSTFVFGLYEKFYSKKVSTRANLNDLKKVKEWGTNFKEMGISERWLIEKRMFKVLDFEHILKQVREDMPDFVIYSQHLTKLQFKKIDEDHYKVKIEITGTCNNE